MTDSSSRGDMLAMLSSVHDKAYGHLFNEVDRQQLKYVIYLRKSSDESSEKQQKSLGDQLADIKDHVLTPNKIELADCKIIKEEHSAKTSDTRQAFTDMLESLRTGKYQGLIAWHPDRLARNMKEAGEIIDMLDKREIKDLLFATATYEDSANGKMMLGITFALSKQYSEHLSESVLRGYKRRIDEGKYLGKMVHGYRIMDEGFLEPDGHNWQLIQQAFNRRLQTEPESLTAIAKWLNTQDYMQCYGRAQTRSRTVFNDKKLSDLFRESVYAGFLQYGKAKPVDLIELYGFEAMISPDQYMKLNKVTSLDRIVSRGNVLTQPKLVSLLQGRVQCGHCGSNMHTNTGTGKTKAKTYVYLRCDEKSCDYKINNLENPKQRKHQIRAHIVTNAAVETLAAAQFDLVKAYQAYKDGATQAVDDEMLRLLSAERRTRANTQQTKSDLEKAKSVVADPAKAEVAKYYEEDIKRYVEIDLPKFSSELKLYAEQKASLKATIVSEEKFIKLMENVVNYIGELTDLDQIDDILQKFYSNFTIIDKSVSVITFNQEWYDVLNPGWLGKQFLFQTFSDDLDKEDELTRDIQKIKQLLDDKSSDESSDETPPTIAGVR